VTEPTEEQRQAAELRPHDYCSSLAGDGGPCVCGAERDRKRIAAALAEAEARGRAEVATTMTAAIDVRIAAWVKYSEGWRAALARDSRPGGVLRELRALRAVVNDGSET
jgi:hypothetical protein